MVGLQKFIKLVSHLVGIKYGGSMMWTQWSVVSSYPTAGNPPPVTQSTKEVTPQNVNKKKKDEVTKAKKKEKQQHVEVKFIDPEEIAAKQQVISFSTISKGDSSFSRHKISETTNLWLQLKKD